MIILSFYDRTPIGIYYYHLIRNVIVADSLMCGISTFGCVYATGILINMVSMKDYLVWVREFDVDKLVKQINLKTMIDNYPELINSFNGNRSFSKDQLYFIYYDGLVYFLNKLKPYQNILIESSLSIHIANTHGDDEDILIGIEPNITGEIKI